MKVRLLCRLGLLSVIALTIFMLEAQLPPIVPIPGVKLGLANIVTVFAAFTLGPWPAVAVLSVRIFLGAVFSGQMSTLLYSAVGGVLAIVVTILLSKALTQRQIWVAGCLGAVAHNLGQLLVAVAVTQTPQLVRYLLPVLLLSGSIAGLFTGLSAQMLINHLQKVGRNEK